MTKQTFGQGPREPGFDLYYAAIDADNAWQAELDRLRIDRYSLAARGDKGSELRRLYDAKMAANEARFQASQANRNN